MLTKFTVDNFKSFDKPLTFDLAVPGSYEFNPQAVRNCVVTKGIVYGFNGCGKSNLGLAMLDIVAHLTDTNCLTERYEPYLNLRNVARLPSEDSPVTPAKFEYRFRFGGVEVIYRYEKFAVDVLLSESLVIGGAEVISYDFQENSGFVRLEGAETLNLNADNGSKISRVKYVFRNAILTDNEINRTFRRFMDFVRRMLLFYCLDESGYQGYQNGRNNIHKAIIEAGKVGEFEKFLRQNNVDIHLKDGINSDGEKILFADFRTGMVPFGRIASTGTKALTLFYYWKITMGQNSFVFMDEFDAFYHFELAENVVELLRESLPDTQVIFTTHNTDLLSNDLLRPDCYFLLDNSTIKPLCDLTYMEIRKAHNLQRMFKAGDFQEGGGHE